MQAIEAVLLHCSTGRFSSHILAEAIVKFYETKKLFPAGIVKNMDCIQKWSIRMGRALQRVVPLDTSYHVVLILLDLFTPKQFVSVKSD